MAELRAIASIVALLLLAPFIGIAASIASLLFFFAFPVWIAWRVFLDFVYKTDHMLHAAQKEEKDGGISLNPSSVTTIV